MQSRNKIFYDLAAGALVSLIFMPLMAIPDYQRRRRYKKSFAHQYEKLS